IIKWKIRLNVLIFRLMISSRTNGVKSFFVAIFTAMNALNAPFASIRNAQPNDFKQAAPLIIQAMEDLACFFTRSEDARQAIPLFEHFFQQKQNQYSYENTLIYQVDDQIAGTLTAYDGAILSDLRAPFLQY